MSSLVSLRLRTTLDMRVRAEGLTPDRVSELSELEIAMLPLWHGRRAGRLGDAFDVSGGRSARIRIEGALERVEGVGAGMSIGEIHVDGHAGARVGVEMRGGTITVFGDAGDEVGAGMSGGLIRVHGAVGHRLGAALSGESIGMRGGEIIVDGSAGDESGTRLRRGVIVVGGPLGRAAARDMIAGSLVAFGPVGDGAGHGNRRGTIVAGAGIEVPRSYVYACTYEPPHVRVTLKYLADRHGLAHAASLLDSRWDRYCGDASGPRKGEILVRART